VAAEECSEFEMLLAWVFGVEWCLLGKKEFHRRMPPLRDKDVSGLAMAVNEFSHLVMSGSLSRKEKYYR
jgi:hypothetical protein